MAVKKTSQNTRVLIGPRGLRGETGPIGPIGPTGPAGATGPRGASAPNGGYRIPVEDLDNTGATDCGITLTELMNSAVANGQELYIPKGTYLIDSVRGTGANAAAVSVVLTSSLTVVCHPDAKFIATENVQGKVLSLTNTNTSIFPSVKWTGGQFDISAMPNSPAGQAWDCMSIAGDIYDLLVERVKFYSGVNGSVGGGDSQIFPVAQRIRIKDCVFTGAWDNAIYVSGKSTLDFGQDFSVTGCSFINCIGLAVKRKFKRSRVINNDFEGCPVGLATADVGGFSGQQTTGYQLLVVGNNFKKCTHPISVRVSDGSIVSNNIIEDWGTDTITGVINSISYGISIEGSSNCVVSDNTLRQVEWGRNGGNKGIAIISRAVQDAGTYNSTNNQVSGNHVAGASVGYFEGDSAQDGNLYIGNRVFDVTTHYDLKGATSLSFRPHTTRMEIDAPSVSIGGNVTIPTLLVTRVTNQANWFGVTGAAAGNSVSIGTAGSDTNVNLAVAPKGTGVLLLGGAAGSESLRVSKGATSGNAVQIDGQASGTNPVIVARGVDANLGLNIRCKGSGNSSLQDGTNAKRIEWGNGGIGLNGSTPVAKGTITGSRGGNAALASLITYLASRGDITDSTTA